MYDAGQVPTLMMVPTEPLVVMPVDVVEKMELVRVVDDLEVHESVTKS